MSRSKALRDVENNNRKSQFYLEAIGETQPGRLSLLPTSFSPSDKSPHITVREPAYLRVEYKGPGTCLYVCLQPLINNHKKSVALRGRK